MESLLKYFLFNVLLKYTNGESFRCDYKFFVGGWLKYQEIPANWYDARLRCTLEGAILASPVNGGLLGAMTALMNSTGKNHDEFSIFTGFHATFSNGDYHTVDGIPLARIGHQWRDLEPNNIDNGERCLTMNSRGQLADVSCNQTKPYFCYKPENVSSQMSVCGTPDQDYVLSDQTGSCYKFHTVPRVYSRANFACSAEGGHLVVINSAFEATIIKDLFSKFSTVKDYWKDVAFVGFNDWGEHGEWRTIFGQTLQEAGYAAFAPNEPNNYMDRGEYCGAVYRDAQLNDMVCYDPHAFICEKDPNWPPVCLGDASQ